MIKLLDYQEPHAKALSRALREHSVAIDTSDTGTGKTYTALAVCMELGLSPLVVAPKVTLPKWKELMDDCSLNYLGCFTDAKLRYGKT